jgi:proteasomal ATPase-associated factor 1
VTCTAILGVGKQVISGSKDGSVRLWDVGAGEEVQRWETEGRAPVEAVVLLDLPESLLDVRVQEGQWGILAFTQSGGVEMFLPSSTDRKGEWRTSLDVEGRVASVAYDRASGFLATGHMSGIISLRALSSLSPGPTEKKGSVALVRRNESPVYSLEWAEGDLLVGTAAGLPCRLGVRKRQEGTEEQVEAEGGKWEVWVKEEMAGWEAVGIEGFAVGPEGVWAAGDEGGVRRY